MNQEQSPKNTTVNTDSGAYVGGDVRADRDVVLRDKHEHIAIQTPSPDRSSFYIAIVAIAAITLVVLAIIGGIFFLRLWGISVFPNPLDPSNATKTPTPKVTEIFIPTATLLPKSTYTPVPPPTVTLPPDEPTLSDSNCATANALPIQECQALVTIFTQMDTPLPDSNPCEWPGVTCEAGNVSTLFITDRPLAMLPAEINQLTHLEVLYLQENKLRELPPEVWNLTSLTSLDLSDNQLTTLPAEIKNLWKLKELSLRGNQLETLPTEIGELTVLNLLNLSRMRLHTLPETMGNLIDLTTLYLENNQLETLPKSLTRLKNLRSLDLGQNRLQVTDAELLAWMNQYDPDWADSQTVKIGTPTPMVEAGPLPVEYCSDELGTSSQLERESILLILAKRHAQEALSVTQIDSQTMIDSSNTLSDSVTIIASDLIRDVSTPRYYPGDEPDEYCVSIVVELVEPDANE